MKIFDQSLQKWVSLGSSNSTSSRYDSATGQGAKEVPSVDSMGRTVVRFPAALPVIMLPLILRSPEISKQDFNLLKETVFTQDILNNSLVDYSTFLVPYDTAIRNHHL